MFSFKNFLRTLIFSVGILFSGAVFASDGGVEISGSQSDIKDSVANISFVVNNNSDSLISNLRYSVGLEEVTVQTDEHIKSFVVERKSLPGKDSLLSFQKLTKKFNYELGDHFDGDYRFVIHVENEAGYAVAIRSLPVFTLVGKKEGVVIDPISCQVSVSEDLENAVYSLADGVDLKGEERLVAFCDVQNYGDEGEYSYGYITKTRDGETVSEGVLEEKTNLVSGLTPAEYFLVPHETKPQAYNTYLYLFNEQGVKSNSVAVHHVISGSSATIQSVTLDTREIKKDQLLNLKVEFTGRADYFAGSRELDGKEGTESTEEPSYEILVESKKGDKECFVKRESVSGFGLLSKNISINPSVDCSGGSITVFVKDESGNVLDQDVVNTSDFKTDVERVAIENGTYASEDQDTDDDSLLSTSNIIKMAGALVALIILILIIVLVKGTGTKTGLFLMILSGAILAETTLVYAATTRITVPNGWGSFTSATYVNVTTNVRSCDPGIDFSASVRECANTAQSKIRIWVDGEFAHDAYSACKSRIVMHGVGEAWCDARDGIWDDRLDGGKGACWALREYSTLEHTKFCASDKPTTTFTYTKFNRTVGTHTMVVKAQHVPFPHRPNYNLPDPAEETVTYTVASCDENATCGTADGQSFQDTPATNLCARGDGLSGPVNQSADGSKAWSWTCGGTGAGSDTTCSTNSCTASYGTTCTSSANACGATNTGVYNCSGQCVNSLVGNVQLSVPDVSSTHPTYGETKTSSANGCGAVNITRGSCSAPAPTPVSPSGALCPVGPTVCVTDDDDTTPIPSTLSVPSGGVVTPTAIDEEGNTVALGEPFRIEGGGSTYKVGDKCLVSNPACPGQAPNESYVTCDGTCAVGQPVCGGVQCVSRGNVEGKTNTIYVESAEQCNVIVPSDSVCEIPSFGFRTKNGLYTVDPGTEKTLVWDTVLNATSCTITGPDNTTLAVINNFIRDTSRPQPGHSWTNILPSGEVDTGEINQTSEYEMTCINVDSPEVTERLRITLTPNVIEN